MKARIEGLPNGVRTARRDHLFDTTVNFNFTPSPHRHSRWQDTPAHRHLAVDTKIETVKIASKNHTDQKRDLLGRTTTRTTLAGNGDVVVARRKTLPRKEIEAVVRNATRRIRSASSSDIYCLGKHTNECI